MNEAETRAELIDPALAVAGWGAVEGSRVAREHKITDGRIEGAGRRARADIADYVLIHRGHKLGVIEAKARDAAVTEGLAQAKAYAHKLQVRFTYATNGLASRRMYRSLGWRAVHSIESRSRTLRVERPHDLREQKLLLPRRHGLCCSERCTSRLPVDLKPGSRL